MRPSTSTAVLLLALWAAWTPVGAEPRYVSDELAVTLRKDKGPDAPVLGLVPSGTEVELLETDAESGYARIRVDRRREGWTLARHLSAEPAARARAAVLQRQLAERSKKLDQLQGELALLRDENQRLVVERDEARQKLRETSRQLVPGSALTVEEMAAEPQRPETSQSDELAALTRSVQELQQRLAAASVPPPRSGPDPVLVGVLAIAAGLAAGTWLASRRRRNAPRNWRDF